MSGNNFPVPDVMGIRLEKLALVGPIQHTNKVPEGAGVS